MTISRKNQIRISCWTLILTAALLGARAQNTNGPAPTPIPDSTLDATPIDSGTTIGGSSNWTTDYKAALLNAKAEKKLVLLDFTGSDWCGFCHVLDKEVFGTAAFKEFAAENLILVKVDFPHSTQLPADLKLQNDALSKQFNVYGYPTLVVLDADGGKLYRKSGYMPGSGPVKLIVEISKAVGLPLPEEMAALGAKLFNPDNNRITDFLNRGDRDGLLQYLAPAKEDSLRTKNYIVGRMSVPPGTRMDDVTTIGMGAWEPISKDGSFLITVRRPSRAATRAPTPMYVWAPGCLQIYHERAKDDDTAVQQLDLNLEPLSNNDAAALTGQVLLPNGDPAANAIVRICGWATTRTDAQGNFTIAKVSPGSFKVRAEAPGEEFQTLLTFAAGQTLTKQFQMNAVTTIGIRWALQTIKGSRALVGDGVRTGEAFFSANNSRFSLVLASPLGPPIFDHWGSDFDMELRGSGNCSSIFSPDDLAKLNAAPPGTPYFRLVDVTSYRSGLHKENQSFDSIESVNGGAPVDDRYFKFLCGPLVKKGDVYTVRCVEKDLYAKMEITDITIK